MANSDTIIYTPDQNQAGNILPWMLASQNGWGNNGFLGGGGFGAGILGGLFGGLLFGGLGNGGWFGGNGGNGGNANAAALAAQATANASTELIMQAINGTDANVRALAAATNSDFNALRDNVCAVRSAIDQVASQVGMTALQVQNAVLSGDASIASQLCQCCCEMKQLVTSQGYENQLATLNQTNQLGAAISGSGQRTVDAIADLKTTMVKEFCDARERDMQATINQQADTITQLRNSASNNVQTALFQNGFNVLSQKIAELAAKTPNTIPVQWPQITAVNTTPTIGSGWGFGNGFGWGGFAGGLTF